MSFLRVKKRVKFNVELIVVSLSDVPLLNAVIFAKVRLLECGSFEGFTWHRPVHTYKVDFMKSNFTTPKSHNNSDNNTDSIACDDRTDSQENPQPFLFQCRIPFDERTGELEECRCKISLRREDRGGKAPLKLGFVIFNLSEFAASGTTGISQSFLLDGYTAGGQRQDNSRINVHVKMVHQAQDPLFKVPKTTISAMQEAQLNPADRKAPPGNHHSTSITGLGPRNPKDLPNTSSDVKALPSRGDHLLHSLHHYHLYDDRPSSCTNFSIPSLIPTAATDQRASWHAGASSLFSGISNEVPSIGVEINGKIPSLGSGIISDMSSIKDNDDCVLPPMTSAIGVSSVSVTTGLNAPNCGPLANRIQKTRRDASGVIEEVLAETSALLASEAASTSALSWEGIGGYDVEHTSNDEDYEYVNRHGVQNNQRPGPLNNFLGSNNEKDIGTNSGGLALLISKDRKNASVASSRLVTNSANIDADNSVNYNDDVRLSSRTDRVLPLQHL